MMNLYLQVSRVGFYNMTQIWIKEKDMPLSLGIDNHENELHHIISYVKLNDSGLLSGCLYTDIVNF